MPIWRIEFVVIIHCAEHRPPHVRARRGTAMAVKAFAPTMVTFNDDQEQRLQGFRSGCRVAGDELKSGRIVGV
ncbi:hypothetical protein AWN88_01120 [Agrobacterium tumefaciens]|nr:hypothetical protein AWN88_01120 [Agrobacterium tumefaciens]KAJ34133.1 hypothetical protein BW45_05340 [Agrobacterium tumefaciens]